MTADFSREMRDKTMFKAIQIRAWVVICTRRDMPNAQDFVRELMMVGPPMGVHMQQPQLCVHPLLVLCACTSSLLSMYLPTRQYSPNRLITILRC